MSGTDFATQVLLASAYMSEGAADNGAAFKTFLEAAVSQKKVAVIDGKFNIQTPQVFTGLGQFTIRSAEPNKIDAGQGPELNYIGDPTDQPLFKFVGCSSHSVWGIGNYGVTINLNQLCKYGINTHVSATAGENTYSLASWQHENLIINSAADGGACYRMTGSINNSEHRFFRCRGYSGNHVKGMTGVSLTTGGSGYTNGTYYNVMLVRHTGSGSYARATITVSGGAVTGITLTARGSGYTVGDVVKIHTTQSTANAGLLTGLNATFTVTSIVTAMNVNDYPFSNMNAEYGAARVSVADFNSLTPWVIGTAIPTTGTWVKGQHILNWTPTGGYGTPVAWYCVTGGTFGGTNPTFATVPNGIGGLGLGDPLKGAAWLEVDNPNSVNIEVAECGFSNGAQGIRLLRGGMRVHDTNAAGNCDVDVFAANDIVYSGGWTEQSNRFMFEPGANTLSGITVENVRIASYPHWYALQNGYDQRPTEVASFAPIWTNRWRGMKVANCTIGTDTTNTLPKKVIFYVQTTYPPVVDVTNTYTRKAGIWNDSVFNENLTPNIVWWSGFN